MDGQSRRPRSRDFPLPSDLCATANFDISSRMGRNVSAHVDGEPMGSPKGLFHCRSILTANAFRRSLGFLPTWAFKEGRNASAHVDGEPMRSPKGLFHWRFILTANTFRRSLGCCSAPARVNLWRIRKSQRFAGASMMPSAVSCLSRSWPQAASISWPFSRRRFAVTPAFFRISWKARQWLFGGRFHSSPSTVL